MIEGGHSARNPIADDPTPPGKRPHLLGNALWVRKIGPLFPSLRWPAKWDLMSEFGLKRWFCSPSRRFKEVPIQPPAEAVETISSIKALSMDGEA